MGLLPLAFAIAEPEADVGIADRVLCCESDGVVVCALLSRSEDDGEDIIWLSPSWSADIVDGGKTGGVLLIGSK